jgi:hypothetical protein
VLAASFQRNSLAIPRLLGRGVSKVFIECLPIK